jgi:hypothetical protein
MDPTTFKLRRVLVGVVVGLLLVSLAFYGWVQYRRSQYNERRDAVLGRYHNGYTLCVTAGNYRPSCAASAVNACVRDAFWSITMPFKIDPESPGTNAGARCRAAVAG